MAYPPVIPPSSRTDATPMATNHPNDHNKISGALTDIISELGNDPSSPKGTVQARLNSMENNHIHRDGSVAMTDDLNLGGNYVINLGAAPPGPGSAVPRQWVNDNFLPKDGSAAMTGDFTVLNNPADGPGVRIYGSPHGGEIASTVNQAGEMSLNLRRGPAANASGEQFVRFEIGAAPGTLICAIQVNATTNGITITSGNIVAPSDYRLKERTGTIGDAAERVRTLARRAFRGRWRDQNVERDFLNAHDVADVAPYAVTGTKDGAELQGVDYAALTPMLIAALGNALDRITVLEAR